MCDCRTHSLLPIGYVRRPPVQWRPALGLRGHDALMAMDCKTPARSALVPGLIAAPDTRGAGNGHGHEVNRVHAPAPRADRANILLVKVNDLRAGDGPRVMVRTGAVGQDIHPVPASPAAGCTNWPWRPGE